MSNLSVFVSEILCVYIFYETRTETIDNVRARNTSGKLYGKEDQTVHYSLLVANRQFMAGFGQPQRFGATFEEARPLYFTLLRNLKGLSFMSKSGLLLFCLWQIFCWLTCLVLRVEKETYGGEGVSSHSLVYNTLKSKPLNETDYNTYLENIQLPTVWIKESF